MGLRSFFYKFVPEVWYQGPQLRTNAARMYLDAVLTNRRRGALRWAIRQLTKVYSEQQLSYLYGKYIHNQNPSRLSVAIYKFRLRRFIKGFVKCYNVFSIYYRDCISKLSDILTSGEREEYKQLTDIEVLFQAMNKNRNKLLFPKGVLTMFKQDIWRLASDLNSNLKRATTSATRVSRDKHPVGAGIFSGIRWKTKSRILRSVQKITKLFDSKLSNFRELFTEAMRQLQSQEKVGQEFPALLIQIFLTTEQADKELAEISTEVQELLERQEKEFEQVSRTANSLAQYFQGEISQNQELAAVLNDISELKKRLPEIESMQYKNLKALLVELKKLINEDNKLFVAMEENFMWATNQQTKELKAA
ncbi:MAG: hypothetical protein AABX33_03280 [Nanoarchaeota archaeon]